MAVAPQFVNWPEREYWDAKREYTDPGPYIRNEAWVNANMHRVDSYKQIKPHLYSVSTLIVERSEGESFEELIDKFWSTEYRVYNSPSLATGVNCQGMTCYLVSWAQVTGHEYRVNYSRSHVTASILYGGEWFEFSFTADNPYIRKELEDGDS